MVYDLVRNSHHFIGLRVPQNAASVDRFSTFLHSVDDLCRSHLFILHLINLHVNSFHRSRLTLGLWSFLRFSISLVNNFTLHLQLSFGFIFRICSYFRHEYHGVRISFELIIPYKPNSQVIVDVWFFLFLFIFRLESIDQPVIKLFLFFRFQELFLLVESSDTLFCQVIVGDLGSDGWKVLDWFSTVHPFEIVLFHIWVLVDKSSLNGIQCLEVRLLSVLITFNFMILSVYAVLSGMPWDR